jgi:bifunctional UDP-N-acetylglucosamine pyrophosphorylase/glucosamine-1-phosphate N-acetyltransferase
MKLIILAAWEGSRLKPLTNTIPKPLIKIIWKPIAEHNLENIVSEKNKHLFDEIIFIVKYKKEKIIEYFWDSFNWVKIKYQIQNDKKWTWAALMWLDILDDILIINWDSIFGKNDLDKIVNYTWYWVLVQKVDNPQSYWIFQVKEDLYINKVIEKPKDPIWNLANLWVYKFSAKFLEYIESISISPRWEYEITDSLNEFALHYPLKAIEIEWEFIDIWYSWNILTANEHFLNNLSESNIKWTVEDWVTIKWNIILEEGAILKSGTYIEWNCYIWKNTSVWPNIYLRWTTSIWANCKIWANNEIKNSNVWENTNIAHLSYIWDSIIWNNVNIWCGFITANLRHDKANIKVPIKWILTDTGLHKLWIIIWDNCKTWINSSSMPWRILENNIFTNPGTIIK